jgi:NAD(P)-dependent dehydrogenase (short-subunit alcohol dehydrogenase family)
MQNTNAQGLVALVTGANRGIGLETSRQLAAQGVTVIMAGRNQQSTEAAARALQSEGFKVVAATLDVVNPTHIESLRAKIEQDFGHLDILINNAGIITGESFMENSAQTITQAALRETFEVNLFAPIALTQAMLPLLKAAPAARIVNLTSVLGSLTLNSDPNSPIGGSKALAYNASKAAVNMFTINLAQSLKGTNIKVNAAHPGWVKTDMGSEAAPMEIVDGAKTSVALALLGPDGPTGQFIHLGDNLPW